MTFESSLSQSSIHVCSSFVLMTKYRVHNRVWRCCGFFSSGKDESFSFEFDVRRQWQFISFCYENVINLEETPLSLSDFLFCLHFFAAILIKIFLLLKKHKLRLSLYSTHWKCLQITSKCMEFLTNRSQKCHSTVCVWKERNAILRNENCIRLSTSLSWLAYERITDDH